MSICVNYTWVRRSSENNDGHLKQNLVESGPKPSHNGIVGYHRKAGILKKLFHTVYH